MNWKEMDGDEIITHFLNTGELPWKYTLKIPMDKLILENGNVKIKYRDYLDIIAKQDNPWEKLNHEQKMLIAANTEGFWENFNSVVLMDIIYRSEKYIALFKQDDYQKAVFDEHTPFETEFMRKTILIYLDLLSNPVKYFDSRNKTGKRILIYIRSQLNFLITMLKKMNDIDKQTTPIFQSNASKKMEQSELVINGLNEYKFFDYLESHNFKTESIYKTIKKHSGKELISYTIALLKELGYLDYFFKEFTKTKSEGFKKLGKVFGVNQRRIKGNVNILNPKSTENPLQFTSYEHIDKIRSRLKDYKN